MIQINPNKVQESDFIEARFPDGTVESGYAVREDRLDTVDYKSKRMMLCDTPSLHQRFRGHIITGCAGFPAGTKFYTNAYEDSLAPGEQRGDEKRSQGATVMQDTTTTSTEETAR